MREGHNPNQIFIKDIAIVLIYTPSPCLHLVKTICPCYPTLLMHSAYCLHCQTTAVQDYRQSTLQSIDQFQFLRMHLIQVVKRVVCQASTA